jgi:hypothetical protein
VGERGVRWGRVPAVAAVAPFAHRGANLLHLDPSTRSRAKFNDPPAFVDRRASTLPSVYVACCTSLLTPFASGLARPLGIRQHSENYFNLRCILAGF